jgi:hypothetical protein
MPPVTRRSETAKFFISLCHYLEISPAAMAPGWPGMSPGGCGGMTAGMAALFRAHHSLRFAGLLYFGNRCL